MIIVGTDVIIGITGIIVIGTLSTRRLGPALRLAPWSTDTLRESKTPARPRRRGVIAMALARSSIADLVDKDSSHAAATILATSVVLMPGRFRTAFIASIAIRPLRKGPDRRVRFALRGGVQVGSITLIA